MFTLIQADHHNQQASLLKATFKLRKKVFFDQLNWDVPVAGDQEFDEYDNDKAQYLVWCCDDQETVYGVVRLIPTSAPTLLFDVFDRTHDNDRSLVSDGTYEGTRMCLDEDMIAQDFPTLAPGEGFTLMLLALCETGLSTGIQRLVSNFEPAMSRIYKRAGLKYHMHGKADGYGLRPVCCASFDVNPSVLQEMRQKMGIDQPISDVIRGFMPQPQSPQTREMVH